MAVKCDQTINDLEGSGTILDDGGNDVAALAFEFDTQYEIIEQIILLLVILK
jgi:hypothetical protein